MRCTLVSNKIIQARERLGLTQQQLAEKLCVTNKAVSKWECGVTLPDISLLVPLCRVLGLSDAAGNRGADRVPQSDGAGTAG